MNRPNIITILADDMGYSDLGCYGGEINTPNIDKLAAGGQSHTQFYNIARCCPSRATLMTGLYPHQCGIGHMTHIPTDKASDDRGLFGYRGFLNRHNVTMAEVLRDSGYETWLSGKWHLGMFEKNLYPSQRGFERFYGILAGGCNYFKPAHPRGIWSNDDPIEPESSYYTTDAFTDNALKFISERNNDAPFFLYLAYNAPHWPLQAPEELVKKYRGRYLGGWDKLREERYERMKKLGIIDKNCALSPRDPEVRAFDTLDDAKKDEMDLRMAVYAAQVERMDWNIGRLVTHLEQQGCLENTLIMFLSDNGACAEGGELGRGKPEEINKPEPGQLMISYGRAWANASNTPYRLFKHYVHEGGIRTPFICHWPAGIRHKGFVNEPGHLIDLMPTVLELSGAKYPANYHGNDIPPLEGFSLNDSFKTGKREAAEIPRYLFWEHEDNCSIRLGKFKALQKYDTGQWELYNLDEDASEINNIASQKPGIVKELSNRWYDWARTHYVVPKNP